MPDEYGCESRLERDLRDATESITGLPPYRLDVLKDDSVWLDYVRCWREDEAIAQAEEMVDPTVNGSSRFAEIRIYKIDPLTRREEHITTITNPNAQLFNREEEW